jgi:subtilisin family serine protease
MIGVDTADVGSPRIGVLRAPGSEVVTLVPGGRYDFLSGASLATAHVSGAIALLLARNRHLNRSTVFQLLERSEGERGLPADTAPINACLALADLLKSGSCPEPRAAAAEHAAEGLLPTPR